MNGYHFDLRLEPWIPVYTLSGTRKLMGLQPLIEEAHKLFRLEFSNPLTNISVFRVLLAAIHSMENGPRSRAEWLHTYSRGRFQARKVGEYFDKWSDRFDLFHERYPFLQTAGLVNQDKKGTPCPQSAALLLHEIASGNNKTLFNHNSDKRIIELSPVEAAGALITQQFFALGGLAKKTTNLFEYQQSYYMAPLVGGIPTILVGDNLFETLVFNLLERRGKDPIPSLNPAGDIPIWERQHDLREHRKTSTPDGYLDYLVPKSRHIRLVAEGPEDKPVVRSIQIAQGVAFPDVEEPLFYRQSSRSDPGKLFSPRLSPDRAIWRDSSALFGFSTLEAGKGDYRPKALKQFGNFSNVGPDALRRRVLRCESYGLANDKANPLIWRVERLQFPDSLLSDENLVSNLLRGLDDAESVGQAVVFATRIYFQKVLGVNPSAEDISAAVDSSGVRSSYWGILDDSFRLFLTSIEDRNAALRWREGLRRAAQFTLNECVLARAGLSSCFYRAAVESSRVLQFSLRKIMKYYEKEGIA